MTLLKHVKPDTETARQWSVAFDEPATTKQIPFQSQFLQQEPNASSNAKGALIPFSLWWIGLIQTFNY